MNHITRQRLIAIVSLIALIFIVYGQVIHFDFVNIDDGAYVLQNIHVLNGMSLGGVEWAFTSSHAANWHPLTSLSLMMDHDIYGLNAGGYHFTNLFFHLINTLLLFLLLNKMTGSFYRSFFVAALFGLHPMHVESVAWISARKDVLSAFFWLLTIWAYFSYAKHPGIKRYVLVIVIYILGLMSKPMVVTLPFVLLLLDYWPLQRFPFQKNLIIEKIPLFVLTVASSVVTFIVQKQDGAVGTLENYPLDVRIYNALISYGRYLEKTLLPLNLSVYYPHPGMWPAWQIILAASIIILLSILIWKKSDRYPYLPVGWLWYLGTLLPVIGIVQVGSQSMADRYSYIPLIGIFLIIAWGVPDLFKRLPHKKTILCFGAILIIIVVTFLSWQRCQLWGDSFALWNDVLKKYNISSPDNIKKNYKVAFAYNFRGTVYTERGNYHKAIEDYNAALEINAQYEEALNNRAIAHGAIGQNDLAFKDYGQALKIKPNYADAYYNRGLLYNKIGRYDMAISDFTSAIKFDPSMADAFVSRGIALGSQRQYDQALNDFNRALAINRNLYQAYFNRGIVYNIRQQYDLAAADFSEVLRLKPDNAEAHNYIGVILAKMGRYEEAGIHRKKTLHIRPDR